jgi:predicted ATPase
LVLFLDDLQWMDPASLKLLEQFVTHPDIRLLDRFHQDIDARCCNQLRSTAG